MESEHYTGLLFHLQLDGWDVFICRPWTFSLRFSCSMQKKRRLSGCWWLSVRGCCLITLIVELLVREEVEDFFIVLWILLSEMLLLFFIRRSGGPGGVWGPDPRTPSPAGGAHDRPEFLLICVTVLVPHSIHQRPANRECSQRGGLFLLRWH